MPSFSPIRPISRPPLLTRPLLLLVVATMGYGLTYWAWTLIGPLGLAQSPRSSVGGSAWTVLAVIAVAVGSLGRIPVGILTDRYGARILLAAIGAAAAVAVLALAAVGSGPVLVAVAALLGVAGTTFAAGSALVVRAYPPGRRGLALSIFGAGMGVAPAAALLSDHVAVDRGDGITLLAVALVGYAGLAAALVRDRPDRHLRGSSAWRSGLDVLRLPATRYLSAWYAVAYGGLVALGLYLPAYLGHVYQLSGQRATMYTAACLTVAAAGRPAGGWLCQRHDPVSLLRVCFTATAAFSLVLAFHPPLTAAATPALLSIAGCLGTASGVVQALIGATAPPERAGTIAGAIGAVGGLAGLGPPLLLAAVHGINDSYGIGLTVLAATALATAAQLRIRGRWIGAALTFPAAATPQHTATTIVTVPAAHLAVHSGQLTAALTTLATQQELVIVSCLPNRATGGADGHTLVAGLRLQLPRHHIIAVTVGTTPHPDETALIADLLNDGALPIVLTTAANPDPVALLLAGALGADHVLHAGHNRVHGILLQPPWTTTTPTVASRR